MTEIPFIQVAASSTFKHNLRVLAKKYRSIRNDIQPVIEQLERGELPGDRIPSLDYEVFKLRVKNSDIKKGKIGGYRLLYYVKTTTAIILLTLIQNLNKLILQRLTLKLSLLSTNSAHENFFA